MPKYTADYGVTGSVTVTVKADSLEEAKKLLEEEGIDLELCVHCSGYGTAINRFPVQFSLDLDDVEIDGGDLAEGES